MYFRNPVSQSPIHEFTPFHVYDHSPDGNWKIITVDASPKDRWQIRIPAPIAEYPVEAP